MLSVEQLISLGVIYQEEPEATLEDGFISYLPSDGYVIQVESQRGDGIMTANKFELLEDEDRVYWCIQLEGLPEDPNTIDTEVQQPFQIFKKVDF